MRPTKEQIAHWIFENDLANGVWAEDVEVFFQILIKGNLSGVGPPPPKIFADLDRDSKNTYMLEAESCLSLPTQDWPTFILAHMRELGMGGDVGDYEIN